MGWKTAILIPFLMVSAGCVETIVMDPHEKDLPVIVNCVLKQKRGVYSSDGSVVQSVRVLYVKGKSTKEYIPIDNAEVYVKAESDSSPKSEKTITFSYTEGGVYETEVPVRILPQMKYTLYVEIPGKETIMAETVSMPEVQLNDHFTEMIISENDGIQTTYPIYRFQTSGADGNCALWINAQEYTPKGLRSLEYLATDHPDTDNFNITGKYLSELYVLGDEEDRSDREMRESLDGLKTIFPDSHLYEKFLHISNLESSDLFFVYGGPTWYLNLESQNYYGKYDSPDPFHPEIKVPWPYNYFFIYGFHIVNKDLDLYLRDVFVHDYKTESYLTALYSTENTYSNITGGTGIFGCEIIENKAYQTNGALNSNWPDDLFDEQ